MCRSSPTSSATPPEADRERAAGPAAAGAPRVVGVEPGLGLDPGWRDRLAGPGLDLPAGERAWLHSGRAALRWLGSRFGAPARVLLPAYICDSVIEAFGVPLFYHVDAALRIDWPALTEAAARERPAALLLVHYFGRLQDRAGLAAFRDRFPGVAIVEDLSHSLLNAPGRQGLHGLADYGVASLRKLLPVPDGAVVVDYRGRGLPDLPAATPPPSTATRLAALASGSFQLFHRAELELDREAPLAAASEVTREIVARVPAADLRARRRANWHALADALRGAAEVRPLHADLPPGVAPLGYPVRCRNRHDLGRRLSDAGVEAVVHWPLPPAATAAASYDERLLAGTLLTLPCGPACTAQDLERIARVAAERPAG
jgi:hypothetical protein